jgi:hypothetical protein
MWKSLLVLCFIAITVGADRLGEVVGEKQLPPAAIKRLAEVRKQETVNGQQDYKLIHFLKCKPAIIKSIPSLKSIDFELGSDKFTCVQLPKQKDAPKTSWSGKTKDANTQCILSVEQNYLTGSITVGDPKTMEVRRYSLKTLLVDSFVWVRVGINQAKRAAGANDHIPRFADSSVEDTDAVQGPTTINVQFGYTANAAKESNGDSAIKSKMTTAIAATNQALSNSKTNVQLKSVGILKVKQNDAAGVPEVSPLLNSMITDKTTKWTDLWGAAKSNKADLIALVTARTLRCGAAKMGGAGIAVAAAYSVMYVNNVHINWDNCFGHEIAHMFGCDHDIKTLGGTLSDAQKTAKNVGYVHSSGKWRTAMAYPNAGSFDTPAKAPHYSDPSIKYLGQPTGVNYENCAAVIRKNAATIANIRTQR